LNRFVISGQVVAKSELRHTPAGVERMEITIRHASEQTEAGMKRQVQCEIIALAFGETAKAVTELPIGQSVRADGFIAQRSLRSTQLVMHINNIILE
jgi:primosomal replication protein N